MTRRSLVEEPDPEKKPGEKKKSHKKIVRSPESVALSDDTEASLRHFASCLREYREDGWSRMSLTKDVFGCLSAIKKLLEEGLGDSQVDQSRQVFLRAAAACRAIVGDYVEVYPPGEEP